MPRRALSPLLALPALALALSLAAGGGCRRAPPPPPQVDIYAQPATNAIAQLQIDAQRGEGPAQNELALRYFGGDGVAKDLAKAVHWWQEAARHGEDEAQSALAALYFSGEGVAADRAQALRLWTEAAQAGNGDAQATLGWLYFNGIGVARDRELGYAWSSLAVGSGVARARANLDAFEASMAPEERLRALRVAGDFAARIRARLAQQRPRRRLQKVGEGTMFVVGADGAAVTANHVVADCVQMRPRGRSGLASLLASDAGHDLALLRVPGRVDAVATLSSDPGALRQGDEVVVFGFPLNAWLSTGGNLTPGWVSALSGLGNDPDQMQITAPIQPGSSGSPVFDQRGVVVGVVSMRLSDSRMQEATGTSGQNLNFAVNGLRLEAFLRQHHAEFDSGGFWRLRRSNADIADEARAYTGVIECWK